VLKSEGVKRRSISERAKEYSAKTKEKEEKIREALDQKEVAGLQQSPTINPRSRQLQRKVEDMMVWEQEKEAKRQVRKAMTERNQEVGATYQPKINRKSLQIYEHMQLTGG